MRKGKHETSPESAECFQTVGDVVRSAVESYQRTYPSYDARQAVASLTGIGYKYLSAFITNERIPRIDQLSNILRVCNYPQGFDHLKRLNFPSENGHEDTR